MSGFLTADAKVFLLNALAGPGDYIGLATSIPSGLDVTLANISEVTTAGYARAAVNWNPAGAADLSVGPVEMANLADVNFPAVTENMDPAGYAFLTDTASGNSIGTPVVTLGTTATTGGARAAGTFYWVVTATNAKGETVASNEVSKTLVANGTQVLSWPAITGATGYNVYRGVAAGQENTLVASVTTTSYTDTGAAGVADTPPATSTAAVGRIFYVWQLAQPVTALAGKPIKAPANGLIIE